MKIIQSSADIFKHKTNIQLRFVDLDAFGHLNNANYLTYFEEARIKYLDDIIKWEYGPSKIGIIMARAEVDFILPGHYKDQITIMTRCSLIGNKSFTLDYKMVKNESGNEILLSQSKSIVVMYDYEKHTSVPVVDEWINAINKFEK